jgi:ribose transport system ATP-binding protein
MMDEPTQGIDIGTRGELYRIILETARHDGRAVLFVSSDHEEIVALADRALVMKEGRIVAEFHRGNLSEDDLIHAAHLGDANVQNGHVPESLPEQLHV